MMKKTIPFAIFFFLLAAPISAVENPAVQAIPSKCGIVFVTDDLPKVLDGLEQSGFGRMWRDPELQDLWKPVRDELNFDNWNEEVLGSTGLTIDELRQIFTGGVAVGVSLNFENFKNSPDDSANFVLAAHVAGKEKQARQAF